MSAVNYEEPAVGADRDAVDRIPLVWSRVLRVLGWPAPVHDEVVVRVVLDDACAAVAVGDEVGPVGQPGDVRRPVESVRSTTTHSELPFAMNQLTVIREAVDHVELVVDDPDVLLFVVGADLDLVRPTTAGKLGEELFEVRPLAHEVALTIEHDDRVLEAALPTALFVRLARRR